MQIISNEELVQNGIDLNQVIPAPLMDLFNMQLGLWVICIFSVTRNLMISAHLNLCADSSFIKI